MKMRETMTKKDLKSGMFLETREGGLYLLFKECCAREKEVLKRFDKERNELTKKFFSLRYLNDGLTYGQDDNLDIVKVYSCDFEHMVGVFSHYTLIWQRKEKVQMKLSDLEKLFGQQIELV